MFPKGANDQLLEHVTVESNADRPTQLDRLIVIIVEVGGYVHSLPFYFALTGSQDLVGAETSRRYQEQMQNKYNMIASKLLRTELARPLTVDFQSRLWLSNMPVGQTMDSIQTTWVNLCSIWMALTRQNSESTSALEATRLNNFMAAYETLQNEFSILLLGNTLPHPILDSRFTKIVVIDTGVDPSSITCGSPISGASFVQSDHGESPWWLAQHAHGTQMAKLITTLDPCCQLRVAKVGNFYRDLQGNTVAKVSEAKRLIRCHRC